MRPWGNRARCSWTPDPFRGTRLTSRNSLRAVNRIDERRECEARNFGRAIDADSKPEGAKSAVRIDVEIFVTIQARVELLADSQDRLERRGIKRNPHHAAGGVAGEHHAGLQVARVESGVGIVCENDSAVVALHVGKSARWLGAPRP